MLLNFDLKHKFFLFASLCFALHYYLVDNFTPQSTIYLYLSYFSRSFEYLLFSPSPLSPSSRLFLISFPLLLPLFSFNFSPPLPSPHLHPLLSL